METLKIDKSTARKLYPETPKWFQEVLSDNFGKEFFSKKITDRINSVQDAYDEASDERRAEYDRECHPGLCANTKAFIDGKLVIDALRQDWKPNWGNGNEKKWLPIYRYSAGSGFGFSDSVYCFDYTYSDVGSRLCLPDEPTSDHFGKKFKEINFILLNS